MFRLVNKGDMEEDHKEGEGMTDFVTYVTSTTDSVTDVYVCMSSITHQPDRHSTHSTKLGSIDWTYISMRYTMNVIVFDTHCHSFSSVQFNLLNSMPID